MADTSQRAIATLAILKVNSDRGADYISNFVPFVAECLRRAPQDVISVTELQATLKKEFGLEIPQGPLRTVLDRAARSGYAERSQRVYRRKTAALDRLDVAETRQRVLREVSALIRKLVGFTATLLPEPWSADQAETALLHYLADRGTSVLASSADGIPLSLPLNRPPDADYVLSAFVANLNETDPEGFSFLSTAVKGSVLASVLYFDDFGSVDQQLGNLEVYLDTVVLLQALGRLGPDQQAASLELIELAKTLNVRLHYFRETLIELEGIHEFTVHCLRSARGSKQPLWGAAEYLVAAGFSASDVQLMAEHLEDDLRGLGITRRERPPHVVALTVDESALAQRLKDKVRYRGPDPLQHDLDALTAIHRLRGGEVHRKIETSRAIFITTNASLARASVSFFREHYSVRAFAPLCMPDHQFATLLWLKKPLAAPDLPTKYILADALAGLNPPEEVWRAYIREIDRLQEKGDITSADYVVLRFAPAAREALMGVTLGGSRAFLEGTVPEILARARAAERADAERKAADESRLRSIAEDALAEQVASTERERAQLQAAHATEQQGLVAAAQAERDKRDAEREARRRRFESVGGSVARASRYVFVVLYIALAAVQVYQTLPARPFGDIPATVVSHPIIAVGLFFVAAAAIVLAVRGGSVASIYEPVERRAAHWLTTRLIELFDPELRDTAR